MDAFRGPAVSSAGCWETARAGGRGAVIKAGVAGPTALRVTGTWRTRKSE